MNCCKDSQIKTLQKEIDQVAAQYVPDKRTGVCNISIQARNDKLILSGETTSNEAREAIIKTLDNHSKSIVDSIIILPDTVHNIKYHGLVTLSVINLRKEPDHAAELVSQSRLGTPLVILKSQGSWDLVQTPDNYISWTEKSSIKTMNSADVKDWKESQRVIYTDNTGWLFDTILANSGVVSDLVSGDILIKLMEYKKWIKVVLPDGRKGYIEKQKATDFENWKRIACCDSESISSTAASFMGVPYLWGGSSVKGVDCSGFVQSVFFLNGIILQRDASLQALHGKPVDISDGFSNLVKGDLLFFGSKSNGQPHVSHVGIYLGDNEYINSAGRVMINSFDSTKINFNRYRLISLLMAKRICGTNNDKGIVPVKEHPWY